MGNMVENTQEEVILEFSENSVSNVLYEEPAKFRKSISSSAYLKAFQITQVILSVNSNYKNKREESRKNGKRGTILRNQEQFFNIIAFSGGRGTGKTSAMLSYMEFLKDYYRNLHSINDEKQLGNLRFKDNNKDMELMFTGLEYIDASLLGSHKDDVLRNVLPKMLKKWHDEERRSNIDSGIVRNEDYAYKKRQVQRLFNNVYKSLRDLNSKEDILEADNDMFMETLENLSLTWNLRQSFQELVKEYLDIMEYPGSEQKIGRHNHFLVISLDDLDMNIEHGFELLEEVRKYLMVPNVIVLLSANYEQLEKLCIEHYTKAFSEIKNETGIKEYIGTLSREYLEKILPSHCQVVMEPINHWKFYEREKISIEYVRVNSAIPMKAGPDTLKEIIRKLLEDYFDMKFSSDGKCLNYLIPSTIRELALWLRQLYSLNVLADHLDVLRDVARIEDDKKADMEKKDEEKPDAVKENNYKKNLRFFWQATMLPMYEKYSGQRFRGIDELEPEAQIFTLKKVLSRDGEELSLFELLSKGVLQTREIQADSVLSIIYLTEKFTELFLDWYRSEDQIRRATALDSIKKYFYNGIWGEWEKKMMCQGVMADPSGIYSLSWIEFATMNDCLSHSLKGQFVNNVSGKEKFVKDNKQTLKNYQRLLLFFDFPAGFSFYGMKLGDEEGNYKIELMEDKYQGRFALSNIMRPWEYKERILTDFLINFLKNLGTDEEEPLGKKIINMIDIRQEDNNYITLPFENVEYLIKTGQTLEDEFRGITVDMEKTGSVLGKIKEFFGTVHCSLKAYDDEHGTLYAEKFENTQIGIELKQEESKSDNIGNAGLLSMLSDSIRKVAVPYRYTMFD